MAVPQRDITFKQCEGKSRSGELVRFAQDEIHLNGRRIGYVGHAHGESANLLAPVDEETRKLISEAVALHRGSPPKSVNSAPQIPDELEGGGDDE